MKLSWAENAWQYCLYWQQTDVKVLQRLNTLIKEIKREPFKGRGKPEPLTHDWKGYWSRRINREHRIVYKFEKETVYIAACRYHY